MRSYIFFRQNNIFCVQIFSDVSVMADLLFNTESSTHSQNPFAFDLFYLFHSIKYIVNKFVTSPGEGDHSETRPEDLQ